LTALALLRLPDNVSVSSMLAMPSVLFSTRTWQGRLREVS
jgi:hypothetical protein